MQALLVNRSRDLIIQVWENRQSEPRLLLPIQLQMPVTENRKVLFICIPLLNPDLSSWNPLPPHQACTLFPADASEPKAMMARWIIAYSRLLRIHFQPEVRQTMHHGNRIIN